MSKPEFLPATFNQGKRDIMEKANARVAYDKKIGATDAECTDYIAKVRNLAGHLAVAAVHNRRAKRIAL